MKKLTLVSGILLAMMVSGCNRAAEPPVLLVYHEGNEYEILDRGDTVDAGQPAYLVRYYSVDVGDENILEAERSDLCGLVARHIETNKHHRVVITSVERKGRLFGLLTPREVTESFSLEEVLKYHPDAVVQTDS